jgi:hypothetical protein
MAQKLSTILGLLQGAKTRAHANVSALHHQSTKPALYAGQIRTYEPRDDEGERRPAESQVVQLKADNVLVELAAQLSRHWDLALWRDHGNTLARADVIIDGQRLLEDVPATFLLFLEKQLNDWRTAITKLPTLATDQSWDYDDSTGLHRTAPVKSASTKKVLRNHVLAKATDKHPEQVKTYEEDVPVGDWTTIRLSGALPVPRQRELVERLDKLVDAVKTARERANLTEVEEVKAAEKLFGYLLGSANA